MLPRPTAAHRKVSISSPYISLSLSCSPPRDEWRRLGSEKRREREREGPPQLRSIAIFFRGSRPIFFLPPSEASSINPQLPASKSLAIARTPLIPGRLSFSSTAANGRPRRRRQAPPWPKRLRAQIRSNFCTTPPPPRKKRGGQEDCGITSNVPE